MVLAWDKSASRRARGWRVRMLRAVKGSLGHSFNEGYCGFGRPAPGLMARRGKSIAKQSEGRAGEKYLPVGARVRKPRAVEDQSAPIPREITSKLGRIIFTRSPAALLDGLLSILLVHSLTKF